MGSILNLVHLHWGPCLYIQCFTRQLYDQKTPWDTKQCRLNFFHPPRRANIAFPTTAVRNLLSCSCSLTIYSMPGSLYQGIRVKGLKMMGHKGVVTRENLGMGINFVSRKKKKNKTNPRYKLSTVITGWETASTHPIVGDRPVGCECESFVCLGTSHRFRPFTRYLRFPSPGQGNKMRSSVMTVKCLWKTDPWTHRFSSCP